MQKQYGMGNELCRYCCNCHILKKADPPTARCIAYGGEYEDQWLTDSLGCGLINRAFLGIRPKLLELGSCLEGKKTEPKNESEQYSFF